MNSLGRRLQQVRAAVTEGRGTLTTTAVLHPIEPDLAGALLPRGLHLHPDASQPRLLLLLSRNHFTSWFGDMSYFETILAVPDVTTGAEPPSVYFRRLYLDKALPRRLGNLIYGWEKLPADLAWDGFDPDRPGLAGVAPDSAHRVRTTTGAPILTATWTAATVDIDPGPLDEVLAQPVLSQTRRRWRANAATTQGGPYARTRIKSEVITDRRPVTGDVRFEAAFDPAELSGVILDGVTAVTLQATQVVSLPRRLPAS